MEVILKKKTPTKQQQNANFSSIQNPEKKKKKKSMFTKLRLMGCQNSSHWLATLQRSDEICGQTYRELKLYNWEFLSLCICLNDYGLFYWKNQQAMSGLKIPT